MLQYTIEWEKEGKTGHFDVHALTDAECVKIGHDEVSSFGGIVTDYYEFSPERDRLFEAFMNTKKR